MLGHSLGQNAADFRVDLAATVLGVGGRGDTLSERIPFKLGGDIGRPEWGGTFDYVAVPYPANALFEPSVTDGAPILTQAIVDATPAGPIQVTSYSQGALIAEQVKRNLVASAEPPDADAVSFLYIASPYVPNGGMFARLPGFRLPGVLPEFGPTQQTPYAETFVTNEYDPYADFPAYFNPLSIANALMGIPFGHGDPYYDSVDLDNLPAGSRVKTVEDEVNGTTDTYILVYTPHLALFAPIRQAASMLFLTPLTEPMLLAIEPLVRLAVDMGYTDRTYENADTPTPFAFVTPPAKVIEALLGIPGALQQGLTDAISAGQNTVPSPITSPQPEAETQDASENEDNSENEDSQQLRIASVPEQDAPEPQDDPVVESVGESAPADPQVVRPTLVADGNKAVPTTTVDGRTPEPAADIVETGSVAPEQFSATSTDSNPPAGGTTDTPAESGSTAADDEADKAA